MSFKKSGINRREFVKLMAVLTGSAGLSLPLTSCGGEGDQEIKDVFDLLRIIRKGIQASPDFLPARAEEVVIAKDAKKIFAFVRDSIQTIPNRIPQELEKNYFDNYRFTELRWGAEGCLRYGAGTFYDKGLLLEKLLNDAGFKAEIKTGDFDIETVGWEKVFFTDFHLAFDPDIPKRIINTRLNGYNPPEGTIRVAEENDEAVAKITKQILDQLPEGFEYTNPDWTILTKKMYEVELETDEGLVLLNPNIVKAEFGESYLSGKAKTVHNSERIPDVTFSLKLAKVDDSHRPVEFFKGSIPAELLFKNQAMLSFQHSLTTRETLTTPRHKIKVLTPMLNLYGTNLTDEEAAKYTFHGKSIHLHGDILEVENDELLVNGEKFETGTEHPELRQKVAKIESTVDVSGFPEVKLSFSPRDEAGNIIERMDGIDFDLLENGAPFPFRLTENKSRPIRVLLVFDLSTSVPDQFRSGAVDFGDKLVKKVQSIHPDAEFMIARTSARNAESVGGWQKEAKDILKNLEDLKNYGDHSSELWHVLLDATTRKGADFIAYFTDGLCTDQLSTKLRVGLKQACPAILLATGDNVDAESLGQMAELTGGITKSVFNHDEVIKFVADYSKETKNHPYSLTYRTDFKGGKNRETNLGLKDTGFSTKINYQAPETPDGLTPGWSGIYLTIRYNYKEITRTIAGKKLFGYDKKNPVMSKHLADTEAAFFGNYRISFEGAEPTFSVLLDEWIAARLSQEAFYKALDIGEKETLEAIDKGYVTYPDSYLFMQSPFARSSGKDFMTFQNGVRASIFSQRPKGGDGKVMNYVDILPFSQWRTIHKDPKTAFEKTISHSLKLMNLEALNYAQSTMSALEGATLELMDLKALNSWHQEIWSKGEPEPWLKWKRIFHHLEKWTCDAVLIPEKRDKEAYFSLHYNSGTVMAMLESGGAGAAETNAYFDRVSQALTAFALVMSALGIGGFIGVWANFEKAKLQWLQKATIAIITMRGPSEEDINDLIRNSGCDAAATLAGALGVPFVEALATLNDMLTLAGHPLISGCELGG